MPLKKGNKAVFLTLNPVLFKHASKKASERAQTIQEFICETLRERVFDHKQQKSKAGRPKKVDDAFIEHFTRNR